MPKLQAHPTVIAYHQKQQNEVTPAPPPPLDADWLRQLCLDAGADDVGFVEIDRPAIADQRADIETALPGTKTLISIVCRMNREPIRSPLRSIANGEFHHTGDVVNDVARKIVTTLEKQGLRVLNPPMAFPMETSRFPGKIWVVSHKPVAVAAGLGHMGIHRNVIHPKFGNFILLGTILLAAEVSHTGQPIAYNPCLECKLCVAACPVGAIGADGHFNFSVCYTHNYREFMSGFTDWAETVADSRNAHDYRRRVSDSESVSMWQSLSFGANYKAAYCISVCPAGEDVIGPYLADSKEHLQQIVKPLQNKEETLYVVPGSDAEAHIEKRFPHKTIQHVSNGIRPTSIPGFLRGMPLAFQRNQAADLNAVYHFTFIGHETGTATVTIRDKTLDVQEGHHGTANLHITADSDTWLKFLAKETSIVWALITRKIKLKGSPKLLLAFGKCFPS